MKFVIWNVIMPMLFANVFLFVFIKFYIPTENISSVSHFSRRLGERLFGSVGFIQNVGGPFPILGSFGHSILPKHIIQIQRANFAEKFLKIVHKFIIN